jgi:type IV secretory pathway TrbL component
MSTFKSEFIFVFSSTYFTLITLALSDRLITIAVSNSLFTIPKSVVLFEFILLGTTFDYGEQSPNLLMVLHILFARLSCGVGNVKNVFY